MSKYSGEPHALELSKKEVIWGVVLILALAAMTGALGVWMLA